MLSQKLHPAEDFLLEKVYDYFKYGGVNEGYPTESLENFKGTVKVNSSSYSEGSLLEIRLKNFMALGFDLSHEGAFQNYEKFRGQGTLKNIILPNFTGKIVAFCSDSDKGFAYILVDLHSEEVKKRGLLERIFG